MTGARLTTPHVAVGAGSVPAVTSFMQRAQRSGWLVRARDVATRWWFVPVVLVVIAAAVRVPGLEGRGQFDADQGNDMMVVWRFLTAGQIPLVGAQASVGDFHQGVLYRLMLLPAAALFGADPLVFMIELALVGIATVVAVWWMARAMGGSLAGAVAGLLVAISPSEIQNSTTIWCVDPIPLFAAGALGAAWRGWSTRRGAWWVAAFTCCAAVAQLHLVGPVFALPVVALYGLQLRRSRADRDTRRHLIKYGLLGATIAALFYLPLVISELQTGFIETRHILTYLGTREGSPGGGLPQVTLITSLRALSFPFSGQITDAPVLAALSAAVVASLGVIAAWWSASAARSAAMWLLGTLAVTVAVLSVGVPSIATVIPGLPNDQYHFFLNPVVFTLAGLGIAALWQRVSQAHFGRDDGSRAVRGVRAAIPAGIAAAALAALAVVSVARWPAATDGDGGWPAMRAAGARIAAASAGGPIGVLSAPALKMSDATDFAILFAGGHLSDVAEASTVAVTCDRLFATVIDVPCGGPAEDLLARDAGLLGPVADRFEVSSRVAVSIYRR